MDGGVEDGVESGRITGEERTDVHEIYWNLILIFFLNLQAKRIFLVATLKLPF